MEVLHKHKKVFSELPPPSKGQSLVQLDLKLETEYESSTLKGRCWPMPKPDQEEIELLDNEMVKAGLAEEYSGKYFPRYCSPAM